MNVDEVVSNVKIKFLNIVAQWMGSKAVFISVKGYVFTVMSFRPR